MRQCTAALALALALSACGGAAADNARLAAETARVVACEHTEQRIEEDASLTAQEARARLACTRLVCDAMHARLAPPDDDGDDGAAQ